MPEIIDKFDGTEYDYLSNFFHSPILFQGLAYDTLEHAYQALKTTDYFESEAIRRANGPGLAKKLGRKATLREDWEVIKIGLMTELVRIKFTTHEDLKKKLLDTGDATLIEGNYWNDTFWGVCKGVGQNNLGIILMKIREELRK